MNEVEEIYFEWLLTRLDPDGVTAGWSYLCRLLHNCPFQRRVGLDINRARDGADLRKEFLAHIDGPSFTHEAVNDLLMSECSWLEMLIALAIELDYLYDGGVDGRFFEMVKNLEIESIGTYIPHRNRKMEKIDQQLVSQACYDVDHNRFDEHGRGGLFPLRDYDHDDQRHLGIWEQHAAYFRERLRGVLWTSTG